MLPTVSELQQLATEQDRFVCEDGVNATFLHNITPHRRTINRCFSDQTSLFQLLEGFFQFYSEFDFSGQSLNPGTGEIKVKDKSWPKSSALDIYNPLGKSS